LILSISKLGFGGLAWGQGQCDLPNASAQLSGFSLTANQGQAVYTPLSGWDAYAWGSGSWGDIPNATAIPLGINLSAIRSSNTNIKFRLGKINLGFFYLEWLWNSFTNRSFCKF
jgi:hypothetical protein